MSKMMWVLVLDIPNAKEIYQAESPMNPAKEPNIMGWSVVEIPEGADIGWNIPHMPRLAEVNGGGHIREVYELETGRPLDGNAISHRHFFFP